MSYTISQFCGFNIVTPKKKFTNPDCGEVITNCRQMMYMYFVNVDTTTILIP